jgi:NAD(P)-dependent dehydrogenase (short-subunit alcohol dehydrogenase family)
VGKSVIVTGSGSGIGRQCAIQFAAEGGSVVIADINAAAAQETVALIRTAGGTAHAVVTDVSDAAAVEAMIDSAVRSYGRIDVLHNNAYWAPLFTTIVDTTEEQWDRTIDVTLKSVYLGARFGIPRMIETGGGVIVNTVSTSAHVGGAKFAAYTAAKGGVLALSRSIAHDFGKDGIRCNNVSPGLVETPATAAVFANAERVAAIRDRLVVGRHGQPADIANAVLFVASDEASYMTGQTIIVDGGWLGC